MTDFVDRTVNPIIYETEKDLAWSMWQTAFDAGKLLPDHKKFEDWWFTFGLTVQWKNMKEMMQAAWGKGVQDRNEQCTAAFESCWQQIVDSQPVTK